MMWADGGNPDPTSTRGKEAGRAKALELARWSYPRHLRGRVFSVIVRGDAAGAEALRRNLHDALADMALEPAGHHGDLDAISGISSPTRPATTPSTATPR